MYGSRVVELSDEEILSRVTCLDIFSYYIGKDFKYGRAICSPLRKDKSPSFTIFKHNIFSKILVQVKQVTALHFLLNFLV